MDQDLKKEVMAAFVNTNIAMLTLLQQFHNEFHAGVFVKSSRPEDCELCKQYIDLSKSNQVTFDKLAKIKTQTPIWEDMNN